MAERTDGAPKATAGSSDESERALGRLVGLGLPATGVVGAIIVGFVAGLGSALLVVAAAALLGTIGLLWASVRTLGGDAPLASGFEALGARRHGVDALAERKRRVLRALKDMESEHALGKLDDADYETLVDRYRDEAKTVMKEIDLEIAPLRAEAERVARAFLAKQGLSKGGMPRADEPSPDEESAPAKDQLERVACAGCDASNEPDAAFCKKCGAALVVTHPGADDASA